MFSSSFSSLYSCYLLSSTCTHQQLTFPNPNSSLCLMMKQAPTPLYLCCCIEKKWEEEVGFQTSSQIVKTTWQSSRLILLSLYTPVCAPPTVLLWEQCLLILVHLQTQPSLLPMSPVSVNLCIYSFMHISMSAFLLIFFYIISSFSFFVSDKLTKYFIKKNYLEY